MPPNASANSTMSSPDQSSAIVTHEQLRQRMDRLKEAIRAETDAQRLRRWNLEWPPGHSERKAHAPRCAGAE